MRFTAFLPALALLSSVLGLAPQPMSANPRHLASRALLNVNGCVTLAVGRNAGVNVAGVGQINLVLQEALCLCTTVGAVGPVATAESLTNIENSLSRNTGITLTTNPTGITPVTVPITVGGLAALGVDLTSVLVDALILALPAQNVPAGSSNVCPNYPTGGSFEPVAPTTAQCASCFFRCIAPTPFLCPDGNGGRVCQATQCSGPSAGAIVQRRWLANQANVDLLCPTGLTACAIPGRSVKAGLKVDCLDTKSDVETCGGCEFPLHGQPKGVDCSVIDNAGSVSCVNGQCIVHSCRPGFVLVGSDCVRALRIE